VLREREEKYKPSVCVSFRNFFFVFREMSILIDRVCEANLLRIAQRGGDTRDATTCLANLVELGRRLSGVPLKQVHLGIGWHPMGWHRRLADAVLDCIHTLVSVDDSELPWKMKREFQSTSGVVLMGAIVGSYTGELYNYAYPKLCERIALLSPDHFMLSSLVQVFPEIDRTRITIAMTSEYTFLSFYFYDVTFTQCRSHQAIKYCRGLRSQSHALMSPKGATRLLSSLLMTSIYLPVEATEYVRSLAKFLMFECEADANGLASAQLQSNLTLLACLFSHKFVLNIDVRPLIDLVLMGGANPDLMVDTNQTFAHASFYGRCDLLLDALHGRWADKGLQIDIYASSLVCRSLVYIARSWSMSWSKVQMKAVEYILEIDKHHHLVWRPAVQCLLATQHVATFTPDVAHIVLDYIDGTQRASDPPPQHNSTYDFARRQLVKARLATYYQTRNYFARSAPSHSSLPTLETATVHRRQQGSQEHRRGKESLGGGEKKKIVQSLFVR
jgi:hypothetical protein